MSHKNQLIVAQAIVILPDKRVLLRRPYYQNSPNNNEWSATIEKTLFETDNPNFVITKAISNVLNINLSLNPQIPKATIRPLNPINLSEHNRIIFPFVVEIRQALTLKLSIDYQFVAEPFTILLDNIINNTIYSNSSSIIKHTTNTVHVIKEVHLKGVLPYVPVKR